MNSDIIIQGAVNFRDLGGISTSCGKTIKKGLLFRSDELSGLTAEDLQSLNTIQLKTVLDFRTDAERQESTDRLPSSVSNTPDSTINPGSTSFAEILGKVEQYGAEELMFEAYERFACDSMIQKVYRMFFECLQADTYMPLLFHCSAGKDRTGYAAALFLSALGVTQDVIMEDYLYSNQRLEAKYREIKLSRPRIAPMFEVKAAYLEHSFNKIDKKYGSLQNYLRNELQVSTAILQKRFLE